MGHCRRIPGPTSRRRPPILTTPQQPVKGSPSACPDIDSDGYRLTLRLLLPDAPSQRALAQGIAAGWALLDVRVEIDARPNAEYAEALAARDFDVALVELDFSGSADPDVYAIWHEGQIETGQNFGAVATVASARPSSALGKKRTAAPSRALRGIPTRLR